MVSASCGAITNSMITNCKVKNNRVKLLCNKLQKIKIFLYHFLTAYYKIKMIVGVFYDWSDTKIRRPYESLTGVPCSVFDVTLKELGSGHFCAGCPARCDFINTHLYGCWEAHRWGGKYIYYCPAGVIFVAAAVANETGMLQSGVLAGPIVMGNAEDFDAPFAADGIINLTTTQVNDLAELMGGLFPTLADNGRLWP